MKRGGHYIIAGLFLLFAVVQWNDPDPYLWIVLYLIVGVIPLFYLKGKLNSFLLGALSFILLLSSATYVPALIEWLNAGMPSITGAMKAESLHIEFIRELFGLWLSLAVVLYYYFKSKKQVL